MEETNILWIYKYESLYLINNQFDLYYSNDTVEIKSKQSFYCSQ